MLCYTILYNAVLYYTTLYYFALYYAVLFSTLHYYSIVYKTIDRVINHYDHKLLTGIDRVDGLPVRFLHSSYVRT